MIPYNYTVIQSDKRGMVLRFTSPGRQTMDIGTHAPRVGESLDTIAAMYAPIANWLEVEVERVVVPVGTSGGFVPPSPEPETLESVKAEKRAEIAAWRYEKEVGGVVLNGISINTERDSQAIIGNTLLSMREGLVQSVNWKTADGTFVPLGPAEIEAIAGAVVAHVQACFNAEAMLLAEVAAAQTIEAVRAIELPAEIIAGAA